MCTIGKGEIFINGGRDVIIAPTNFLTKRINLCNKRASFALLLLDPLDFIAQELEATVLLESYNLVAIIETWWDESHDWSVAVDSYRLFRRDRGDVISDLLVTNASKLSDIKIGGSLGCSNHALVEFAVLRDVGQAKSKVRTLNFRKANFQLSKELVNRTPWKTALRDKGAEQSRQIFKDAFHKAQELSIPRYKKSGKEGKRQARMSQDLLVKLKGKKEMHRQWKQGQTSWEEYRYTARLCRDGVRKAKAQLELNLARDAKNNKKGFYRYVSQKRKVKESIAPPMNMTGK
ncbi:hypothetical protein QYF61_017715 [Mycteria americana]|uniref:Uncharacterized protein n=1 Tax=Mycteria americana TaxID=33587 RepID=A0AAN7S933_MYCAM|nr:hypothetical protein QYF61_017715 [Mycteria americana]